MDAVAQGLCLVPEFPAKEISYVKQKLGKGEMVLFNKNLCGNFNGKGRFCRGYKGAIIAVNVGGNGQV